MHPFGGIPKCPRCEKTVYAAEQIMGPGRNLYHKFCLSCKTCNKRLDSLSLYEHDQEPYCKQCYNKQFGPRDLRQANLPHRDDLPIPLTPSSSPTKQSTSSPRSNNTPLTPFRGRGSPPLTIGRESSADVGTGSDSLNLNGDSQVSPIRRTFSLADEQENASPIQDERDILLKGSETILDVKETIEERRFGGIPRTVPLNIASSSPQRTFVSPISKSTPLSPTSPGVRPTAMGRLSPIRPTITGTRYGVQLAGNSKPLSPVSTGSSWSSRAMPGTGTPLCARCQKPVYFAEQVKAVGKTFHKPCLRCTECNTSLDSTRLTEREGQVICKNCYSKLYGPQGSGYALLGKAGG